MEVKFVVGAAVVSVDQVQYSLIYSITRPGVVVLKGPILPVKPHCS